jgi:hypothetical protein
MERKQDARLRFWLLILFVAVSSVLVFRWAFHTRIGTCDFGAYWSASYLFSRGENPCSASNMLAVERTHVKPSRDRAMMAWNPPTLWVFLLPLAQLSFDTARAVWLLTNIGLLAISCLMLQRVYFPDTPMWVLVVFYSIVVLFGPVLIAILYGQVVFLVLFGIAAALFLIQRQKWWVAGLVVILTTPKPHLAMLSVPYLMSYLALRRRWRGWLGLGTAGVACLLVLFALRPSWMLDYAAYLDAPLTEWKTPTIGGVMRAAGVGRWAQFVGLGLLVLLPVMLWDPQHPEPEEAVSLLTLVTVPSTFFGWSYDQSLLIVPIAQVVGWLSEPEVSLASRLLVGALALAISVASLRHRVVAASEAEFLWVPLAWGGVYALAWTVTNEGSSPIQRVENGHKRR